MNRYTPWILMVVLLAVSHFSQAELQLDTSKKPKQVEAILKPLFESVVRPYGDLHSADFGGGYGKRGTSITYQDSNFSWIFNGESLLSNVGAFAPEVMPLEDCSPDPNELNPGQRCDWRRTGFKVCHLFIFNGQSLKLESVTRLNIMREKKQLLGLPRCHGIEAMSIAKAIPDAMLITMSYIDSAERADKHYDPPEFFSTVLLRFRSDNGKLKIVQDDSCLGNPNKYKTIAAARKALAACAGTNPVKK